MQLPPRYRIVPRKGDPLLSTSTFHYLLLSVSVYCSHIHSHWSQMKGLGFDAAWKESASGFLMNLTSKPVPINGNIVRRFQDAISDSVRMGESMADGMK